MTTLQFTTADCQNLLPQVLIDHLWKLAAEAGSDTQTFVLSPKHVGVGDVQDILHRHDHFSSWNRVFGYEPVTAVVEVRFTDMGAIMSLKEERAEESMCSA